MLMKDYYSILGISDTANNETIKIAYRKLSKKFHPDLNNNDKFFEDRFKEIQEAYEVLMSEERKKQYDDTRKLNIAQSYNTVNANHSVSNNPEKTNVNYGQKSMKATLLYIPNIYRQIIFILCLIACLFPIISPPIALLIGLVIALVIGHPFLHLNKKATTLLLQVSVVCLGFNMNLEHALKAGKEGFLFTVCTISVTLVAGYFIGKKLKINKNTSLLISNGTAICGGSAIAAIAPIVKANDEEISVSLGTIFILNSIALLIFPTIGHSLGLSQSQFGTWCAIAIHDTSSVVGAATSYGNEALSIATTIKLERALWIIPIALATAYFQKSKGKIKIPYFIFYFIMAIIASTYLPVYFPILNNKMGGSTLFQYAYLFGRKGLVVTLFLIGSGLSLKTIRQVGWRPILQGVLLWIIIGSISLVVIKGVL